MDTIDFILTKAPWRDLHQPTFPGAEEAYESPHVEGAPLYAFREYVGPGEDAKRYVDDLPTETNFIVRLHVKHGRNGTILPGQKGNKDGKIELLGPFSPKG